MKWFLHENTYLVVNRLIDALIIKYKPTADDFILFSAC